MNASAGSETPTPIAHRSAALISIGDELALGQTLDTNAAWLADRLFAAGVRTAEHATIDDEARRIAAAIERLGADHDLIITTGGLGPTADDLTREALARVLAGGPDAEPEPMTEDARALEDLRAWFDRRSAAMPEANRVQAMRPASARCLPNPNGTAPGLHARCARLGADVFCLPGPPHEMRPMFEAQVVPALRAQKGTVTRVRLLPTIGLGESTVAERLGDAMARTREDDGGVMVGTTASRGVVTCRLRASARTEADALAMLDEAEAQIRERLGPIVFDRRDQAAGDALEIADALPRAVIGLLRARGQRLAVAESCTGGLLGDSITSLAGASDVFEGGWLTYTDALKSAVLGVDPAIIAQHGAVSAPCARAMALGALERSPGAHHCLSITGIAGPGGGSAGKPVGTVWIGQASRTDRASRDGADGEIDAETRHFLFRGGRVAVRQWAARAALAMLRLRLIGARMGLLAQVGGDGLG